jgi:two-component system chemotaxis response regulator CheB
MQNTTYNDSGIYNPGSGSKVRVLIVDDSPLMRKMLTSILTSDPGIEVVGQAADAYEARELIKALNPDVLTLDIEMPGMNGIQFLKNLMRLRPMPVVMVSALTSAGSAATLDALELGAVDFIEKPKAQTENVLESYTRGILTKVRNASQARVQNFRPHVAAVPQKPRSSMEKLHSKLALASGKLVAIGSSTGGTEALKEVLTRFPADMAPVVITQHIPAAFSQSFAERMDMICQMSVHQATEGLEIQNGHVYIAPGDRHLAVRNSGGKLYCHLLDSDPVNQHKPSVEVLFDSIQKISPRRTISVMLTGMGDEGADAMKRLRDAGSYTIAQDEASSVVWGMPGQAYKRGAVISLKPLHEIANEVISQISKL